MCKWIIVCIYNTHKYMNNSSIMHGVMWSLVMLLCVNLCLLHLYIIYIIYIYIYIYIYRVVSL